MINSVRGPRMIRPDDAILFLDFDGVLHPDAAFRTKLGIELRAPGKLMMHAEVLQSILQDFPRVGISLSTSWVRMLGYQRARAALPAGLQERTVSATWHSRMRDTAHEGYDMFTRYEQICGAVTRAGITRWIAIDDDPDFSWPRHDNRLVRCDPNVGLGSEQTQLELRAKLQLFG
ncbi:HAD domain-containing protein [Pseudomonas sp. Kh13]|uniref:HAD domain-containing protein n=1 Tax=Pseudomonas sp. Kh13 TaxID=2093744 RepID=UPI001C499336|nr:HAD domain-containing protein [Pseudomonas sp. Kh13]